MRVVLVKTAGELHEGEDLVVEAAGGLQFRKIKTINSNRGHGHGSHLINLEPMNGHPLTGGEFEIDPTETVMIVGHYVAPTPDA